MKIAKKLRRLDSLEDVDQWLYQMTPPYGGYEYVLATASEYPASEPRTGQRTILYASNEEGEIARLEKLHSLHGAKDCDQAIRNAGYAVIISPLLAMGRGGCVTEISFEDSAVAGALRSLQRRGKFLPAPPPEPGDRNGRYVPCDGCETVKACAWYVSSFTCEVCSEEDKEDLAAVEARLQEPMLDFLSELERIDAMSSVKGLYEDCPDLCPALYWAEGKQVLRLVDSRVSLDSLMWSWARGADFPEISHDEYPGLETSDVRDAILWALEHPEWVLRHMARRWDEAQGARSVQEFREFMGKKTENSKHEKGL